MRGALERSWAAVWQAWRRAIAAAAPSQRVFISELSTKRVARPCLCGVVGRPLHFGQEASLTGLVMGRGRLGGTHADGEARLELRAAGEIEGGGDLVADLHRLCQ